MLQAIKGGSRHEEGSFTKDREHDGFIWLRGFGDSCFSVFGEDSVKFKKGSFTGRW